MNLQYDAHSRARRRQRFILVATFSGITLFLCLVWALRELILPIIVGALVAYLCHPLLALMRRKRVPKALGIVLLLTLFSLIIALMSNQIRQAIPDEQGKLELRVRIQFKLNEKYQAMMQLDDQGSGNILYRLVGTEISPFWQRLNGFLALPESDRQAYEDYYRHHYGSQRFDQPFYRYFLHNVQQHQKIIDDEQAMDKTETDFDLGNKDHVAAQKTSTDQLASSNLLGTLGSVLSIWLAAPFVFLFILLDEGEIKRNMVLLVPNRYFEMTLTVIHNVDEALGRYLRGTFLECSLVGFTLMVGLYLIGVEAQWAFIIGSVAGLANAIPFLGPAIGLLIGLMYALIVEEYSPAFNFITAESMVLWVAVVVGVTQLLDNAFYQPVVLGNAVSLHPLVVILGVMGGSILLGFVGMLFAIPVIVILKVIISTLIKEMKAYQII